MISTNFRTLGTIGALWLLQLHSGCEDVITVDLAEVKPRLVIEYEVYVRPVLGKYGVDIRQYTIHNSTDFYDPEIPEKITPDDMRTVPLAGLSIGDSMFSTVVVDRVSYEASATVPRPIAVDSLTFTYQEGGGLGIEEEEGYRLHVHFTDPPNEENYLRINVQRNDKKLPDYNLYDGKYSDGNQIDYDYFTDTFQPGDVAYVELITMDRGVFEFFETFREIIAGEDGTNIFDITPANPSTNWNNGALGYFGVFMRDFVAVQLVRAGSASTIPVVRYVTPSTKSQPPR